MPTANSVQRHPRPYNWRQEYLHFAVLFMSASWLAGWAALSLNWFLEISLANTLGLVIVHLLTSMILVRWLLHQRRAIRTVALTILAVMWFAAGVTLLLIPSLARAYGNGDTLTLGDMFFIDEYARVPAGPLVILWVMFLWWRGYQLGSVYMTHTRASFSMRLGLLSFVWVALLAGSELRRDTLGLLPGFFFFGLLASSLARADSLNLDNASANRAFGRGWIPSLIVIALLLTVGGYVLALWLAGMDLAQMGEALRTLAEAVVTLLFIVSSPLLLLAQVTFNFLQSVMPDSFGQSYQATGTGGEKRTNDLQAPWADNALALFTDALIIMTLVFLALVLFAFVWFIIMSATQREEYEDEEREALGTGEVVGSLRQALRDSWRRLAGALGLLRQFGLGRGFFAALTIRRIYARMENLAGSRGYPRAAAETPYEYRHTLRRAFPEFPGEVEHITEAYVAVRYGEVPEDPAALQAVRAAWDRLHNSPTPPN